MRRVLSIGNRDISIQIAIAELIASGQPDVVVIDPMECVLELHDFKTVEDIPTYEVVAPRHSYGKRARRALRGGKY